MKQSALAAEQFGATANAYLASAVHSQGADLDRLGNLVRGLVARTPQPLACLDLGCGGGHVAFHLAEAGAQVTACDLSLQMVAVVAEEAARRGLQNLQALQTASEVLPFADASFDLVATRFSAHHWSDVPLALAEARRVVRPGGTLIVIDCVAPEHPLLDTVLQAVEILRDPSHVRDYRVSEWEAMLQKAGFALAAHDTWKLRMHFDTWIARMRTPLLRADAVRDIWSRAAEEARLHFGVADDGSFDIDVAWLQAQPVG